MLFQQFAQERNINWKSINVSSHGIKRAKERLGWGKQKEQQIIGNLRTLLKNSVYIDEIVDSYGELSYMFCADTKALYLSSDYKEIKTVMIHDKVTYTPLKSLMLDLHRKENRKLNRKLGSRIKRLGELKTDCDVDLALIKRRISRTKSQAVKLACEAKIKAIHQTIEEYENEIKSIQDEKRAVSRSLVAII